MITDIVALPQSKISRAQSALHHAFKYKACIIQAQGSVGTVARNCRKTGGKMIWLGRVSKLYLNDSAQ
jgi:hypothetical protein